MVKPIIILASIFFVFISTSSAQAQVEVHGSEYLLSKLRLKKTIDGIQNNTYQDVEGSPYLFEGFQLGKVKLIDDGIFNEQIRFDMYAGEFQFKKENDIYAIAFPEKIEFIEVDGNRFIYSDFKTSESAHEKDNGAYFHVLVDGKCKLLAQKNITIKEAQQSNGIAEAKPAKFTKKSDSYFLKMEDYPAVKINNKKDLELYFEGKGSGTSEFIKKEKIKVKLNDLSKLTEFCNKNM